MLEWATVKRHVAEEITLLCRQHHGEKTAGLLPVEVVMKADKDPYNHRHGTSAPYELRYSGEECEISIGSNTFVTTYQGYGTVSVPVMIDGIALVGFILGDGHLLFNVAIFNEFNELAVRIQNNVITYQADNWDVSFVGRNLVVREGPRKIILDVVFDVPNRVTVRKAILRYNGVQVNVNKDEVLLLNNNISYSGCRFEQVNYGIAAGTDIPDVGIACIAASGIPRYGWNYNA